MVRELEGSISNNHQIFRILNHKDRGLRHGERIQGKHILTIIIALLDGAIKNLKSYSN